MITVLAAIILTIASFVLWGFGAVIQRLTRSQSGPWPVSIGVGLAATVAIGGILNLAHIAYAPVLWTLVAIEVIISALELRRVQWRFDYDAKAKVEIASASILIGLATLFAILTQLPPKTFNSHDDFEKYLAYPVRMLETGTLSGSPLSALGSEVLGGQTFLHGIVLSALPISYINGVDAVFCMAALMLLTASAGWKRFSWFPGTIVGPLLVATINPQYVNISALYSGALLMVTAVMLVGSDKKTSFPSPLLMGLVLGSMVALKLTFAVFVALYFPFVVLACKGGQQSWKPALKWAAAELAWMSAFLAPWILLHLPNYLAHGSLPQPSIPPVPVGGLNLVSLEGLFYGASFFDYTAVVLAAGTIAVLGLIAQRSETDPRKRQASFGILGGAVAGVLSYVATVLGLGIAFGYAQSLRLATPSILGACVVAIAMAPALGANWKPRLFTYFPLLAGILISGLFVPSMLARYRQAARFGSILAFSDLAESPYYAQVNAFWLSPAGKQYIQNLQDKVPAGEPLVTWINTPFLLDYKRNTIIDADTVGLASPWARVPANIHYVLWQYRGPEVRMDGDYAKSIHGPGYRERLVATRSLDFANHLSQVAQNSQVIASDGNFVLFKVRGQL